MYSDGWGTGVVCYFGFSTLEENEISKLAAERVSDEKAGAAI